MVRSLLDLLSFLRYAPRLQHECPELNSTTLAYACPTSANTAKPLNMCGPVSVNLNVPHKTWQLVQATMGGSW